MLPALNAVREQAKLVQCLSNLRQIGIASQNHAADHAGYFPFAGQLGSGSSPTGGFTPSGLNDSSKEHYDYVRDNAGGDWVAPLPLALASYLGSPAIRMDNAGAAGTFTNTAADVQGAVGSMVKQIFTCPGDAVGPVLATWSDGSPTKYLSAYSSYAWNMDVTGYGLVGQSFYATPANADVQSTQCIRAEDSVSVGNDVLLRCGAGLDGLRRSLFHDRPEQRDDVGCTAEAERRDGRESLDYVPALHQNRMNILYVDGHAATVYVYPFTFSSPGTVDWATTKAHHPTDLTTVYIRKIK